MGLHLGRSKGRLKGQERKEQCDESWGGLPHRTSDHSWPVGGIVTQALSCHPSPTADSHWLIHQAAREQLSWQRAGQGGAGMDPEGPRRILRIMGGTQMNSRPCQQDGHHLLEERKAY